MSRHTPLSIMHTRNSGAGTRPLSLLRESLYVLPKNVLVTIGHGVYCQTQKNREHLKNFRKVDCLLANHNKVQYTRAKLITVAVCGLVISRRIGLFFATQ